MEMLNDQIHETCSTTMRRKLTGGSFKKGCLGSPEFIAFETSTLSISLTKQTMSAPELESDIYDAVVLGTGLAESIAAA